VRARGQVRRYEPGQAAGRLGLPVVRMPIAEAERVLGGLLGRLGRRRGGGRQHGGQAGGEGQTGGGQGADSFFSFRRRVMAALKFRERYAPAACAGVRKVTSEG